MSSVPTAQRAGEQAHNVSPFHWRGKPAIVVKPHRHRAYRTPGLVTPTNPTFLVVDRVQGQRNADRNDSIRRGGI